MRYLLLIIILLFSLFYTKAQEFEVREFTVDRTDLAARKSEKRTVNDEPCAIVKITTNIKGMQFDSNMGIVDVTHRDDGYWLYVQPRERRIKLMASNYISLDVNMPEPASASTVYKLVVASKGLIQTSELVKVAFRINQENVYIRLDNQAPVLTNGSSAIFNVSNGFHSFRFIKDKFIDQLVEIDVKEEIVKDIVLVAGQSTNPPPLSGYIIVTSNPLGALVYLNAQQVGATPYLKKSIAGNYHLRLQHPYYYDHVEQFELKEGETVTLPKVNLKPKFGYYQIDSNPSGAEVLIDGKLDGKTPIAKKQISSGHHNITVRMPNYHNHNETFDINDGDVKVFNVKLKEAFGSISITSDPTDAKLFIDGHEIGKTPFSISQYPSGTYKIRLTKELHIDAVDNIVVKDGEKSEKFAVLPKNFGTLNVNATGSDIFLDGVLVGSNAYTASLLPGMYQVKASRDKHRDDVRDVFVINGQREDLTLSPIPLMGAISITSKPFETIGADIYINGNKRNEKTPATMPMLIGSYDVMISKSGFLDARQRVEVREGSEQELLFTMQTFQGSMMQQAQKYKTSKIIYGTLSIAALGSGGYFRYSTLKLADEYRTATTNATIIYDTMERHNLYSTLSFVVAAPFAIMTVVKMIQQNNIKKKINLAVLPAEDGMSFYVSCNF